MNPEAHELQAIAEGRHHSPHTVLGFHQAGKSWVVRVLRPFAKSVNLRTKKKTLEMTHVYDGIWELTGSGATPGDYRVLADYESAPTWESDDPYRYAPKLGDLDLHLISEGRHEQLWQALGAHLVASRDTLGNSSGVSFKLWAPNAQAVRVIGDFNSWDGRLFAMRSMGGSGVWELYIPGVVKGALYKFQILTKAGHWISKIDPMARAFEIPPATACVVTASDYQWQDKNWLAKRGQQDVLKSPISVYELHLGSWRGTKNYRDMVSDLVGHVSFLGFTHVEFMPIAEHPFGGSWGYQVTGYYAPTSRFGNEDDFRYLVDQLHQAGIGVILDWVPAHFPKDEWALARYDGEALYEDADPRRGDHPDWGTHVFNFGRTEVKNFLVANALYWFEEFHIDGLRVDAVASMLYLDYSREDGQWLPNVYGGRENLDAISFLQETNATVYRRNPGVMMIAEESTAFPGVSAPTDTGGLGFGFKWNMGWMHDSLEYIQKESVYRKYHHGEITFSMLYAYDEKFLLPISHDEVVHGKGSLLSKMPGDHWQQHANMRAFLSFMWSHPGKKLLFMGQEFAQVSEWSESRTLDWWLLDHAPHQGMQLLVSELNAVYLAQPALWELDHGPEGFRWIDGSNSEQNVLSFVRTAANGDRVIVIVNFADYPYHNYRIGVPAKGQYQELLNSDAERFGGSNVINDKKLASEAIAAHGFEDSIQLSIPPLGSSWLKLS